MTQEEALKSIKEDGIELGAGDYVELDALKVAASALEMQMAIKKTETWAEKMARKLFETVPGLCYINVYVTGQHKLYIQGNVKIPNDKAEFIKENILPVMFGLIVNVIPNDGFIEAGVIAIKNGEIYSCSMMI